MSDIVKKIKNPDLLWHWSLKPGTFLDKETGKDPYPDLVKGSWTGTIEQWNASLFATAVSMAMEMLGKKPGEETVFHVSESLYAKMTKGIMEELLANGRKIIKNENVPFDTICVIAGEKVGAIKVLNINNKGNLI